MATGFAALLFAALLGNGVLASAQAATSTCQCEGGDYWCASDDVLRYTYNCSGSDAGKALWKKISNEQMQEQTPTEADCTALSTVCEGSHGAHGSSTANLTCDDECYDYCWKKPVGDCADMDDEQMLCVGQCMSYCIGTRCSTPPREWSTCQMACSAEHMKIEEVNFIDYALCMADCSPLPVSSSHAENRLPATVAREFHGKCQCEAGNYWCSSDDSLHYTFNCSGSAAGKALWKRISDADAPEVSDCKALSTACDGTAGAHGIPAADKKCEDGCYDYCWKKDIGDCADDDDAQIFCVGQCMSYCVGTKCTMPQQEWEPCQAACNAEHMEIKEVNFVDYSDCIAKCTTAPTSPYQQDLIV